MRLIKWAWNINKNFLFNPVDSSQYWKISKISENPALVSYKKVSYKKACIFVYKKPVYTKPRPSRSKSAKQIRNSED